MCPVLATVVSCVLLAEAGVPAAARQTGAEETAAGAPKPAGARGGLFRQLGRDFRHFVDRDNLLILAAGSAASLAVHPADRTITRSFRDSEALDGFFEAGDVGGDGLVQVGGAVATYLVGRLAHNTAIRSLGSDLVRAQVVSGALVQALKRATQRTRPDGSNDYSFPSGHASATFATATVLERHFGWKVGIPAFAFATYVAGSRLQENKHFPSDVVFGATLGIVGGRSVTFGRARARAVVAPFVAPGRGLGVAVVGEWR